MGLGSRLFGLTPEECLAGVTRNAARALGLGHDRGTLEAGKRADIAVWDFDHPRQLAYWLGEQPLAELLIAGRPAAASSSEASFVASVGEPRGAWLGEPVNIRWWMCP